MQVVVHEYRNLSRVFMMIESIYSYISDPVMFEDTSVLWLDNSFASLDKILSQYLLVYKPPMLRDFNLPVIPNVVDREKEVTVCLSGGKDSAACAMYYKKLGYKVHLYHLAGVNKAYGDEKTAAEKIAKYLGCELFIDKVRLEGKHSFIEHPLKNYIIANGALHYCLNRGYAPVIATGNFNKSRLDSNAFEVCAGDCMDMWEAYTEIVKPVIPNFQLLVPLATNADTFNLMEKDWELFKLAVSCMSPFRFRAFWKHRCEEQYNIRLFENRCGVCWKCCIEAMWLMDIGKMPYEPGYYAHCVGILANTIYHEKRVESSFEEIWASYMWYPIEMSKAREVFKVANIVYYNGKSVWVEVGGKRFDGPVSTREA